MAINNPSISTSENLAEAIGLRLDVLTPQDPPDTSPDFYLDPPDIPNRLYAWYNGSTDMVELYITDSAGARYLHVSTYNE